MLPSATITRKGRTRKKVDGRTHEIQRLIGRSLRAVLNLDLLGEHSILIDCDVLQADGGTRTASVTGAYVALCDAVRIARKRKWISQNPVVDSVAAVSVGLVGGRMVLDLAYEDDVRADVDMNVVMTGGGQLVEVQGTAEGNTFSRKELDQMLTLASKGIRQLHQEQAKALRRRLKVSAEA